MRRAVIVYRSRTGTTRRLAEDIGRFLASRDIEPRVVSVGDCDVEALRDVDFLVLGCWTSGLMIVRQHPDQPWIDFAREIPTTTVPRVGLFTTYKLATGSMFAQMRGHLADRLPPPRLELKARSGALSASHRRALEQFVTGT
jgi:flavodoxin